MYDSIASRRTLATCIQLIAYTNCAVNPIIYCMLNERFKSSAKKLAVKLKWWSTEDGRGGHLRAAAGRMAVIAAQPVKLGPLIAGDDITRPS